MIADVRIRRLNLNVVQRGAPWLGREDLERTGERVRRAIVADLELLLERALADCAGDERIATIDVDLTLEGGLAGRLATTPSPEVRRRLAHALRQAVTDSLAARPASLEVRDASPDGGDDRAPSQDDTPAPKMPRVLALLLAWHAEGCLAQRLRLFAPVTIARWTAAVWSALDRLEPAPASRVAAQSKVDHDSAPSPRPRADASPLATAQELDAIGRLVELASLAAQWAPFRPPQAYIEALRVDDADAAVHAVDGMGTDISESVPRTASVSPPSDGARDVAVDPTNGGAVRTHAPALPAIRLVAVNPLPQRCVVDTVLPFLMLGPLDRVGWLSAARAAFERASGTRHMHTLGYALALKALPPPVRGWYRAREQLAAAAIAAGLATPPHGEALECLARDLRDDFSALDATIADALVRGHDRRLPLAIVAVPQGAALVEPEGLFVVAVGASWADVAPAALAAAVPLVVDRTLPAQIRSSILKTGHALVATPDQDDVADAAREMLAALGPRRPLAPGIERSACDNAITLAAALALGEISWRLAAIDAAAWAQPEPGLALDRFGDLGATVIVTRRDIEVRLPLGMRSRDLQAAGLLADVDDVPWLGRPLRFAIG